MPVCDNHINSITDYFNSQHPEASLRQSTPECCTRASVHLRYRIKIANYHSAIILRSRICSSLPCCTRCGVGPAHTQGFAFASTTTNPIVHRQSKRYEARKASYDETCKPTHPTALPLASRASAREDSETILCQDR